MKKFFLPLILALILNTGFPAVALSEDNLTAFQQQSMDQLNSFSQPDATVYTAPPLDYNVDDEEYGPDKPKTVNQYSKKYKKQAQPQSSGGGFLLGSSYDFQFLNTQDINNAILRFVTPATFTGCATVSQPTAILEENPPYLLVKITSQPHVNVDKSVRYAPFHCDKSRQFALIDIPLNHSSLAEKGINKLILSGGNSPSRTFSVNTENGKIEIISGNKIASFP